MTDGNIISWGEAIKRTKESYGRFQSEIAASRLAEAEQFRLDYETSITCGHRDVQQGYITIGEFDFQLCAACKAMIAEGLSDDG